VLLAAGSVICFRMIHLEILSEKLLVLARYSRAEKIKWNAENSTHQNLIISICGLLLGHLIIKRPSGPQPISINIQKQTVYWEISYKDQLQSRLCAYIRSKSNLYIECADLQPYVKIAFISILGCISALLVSKRTSVRYLLDLGWIADAVFLECIVLLRWLSYKIFNRFRIVLDWEKGVCELLLTIYKILGLLAD